MINKNKAVLKESLYVKGLLGGAEVGTVVTRRKLAVFQGENERKMRE